MTRQPTGEDQPLNFQPLKRSRRPLAAGDIFVMKLPTLKYLFGRVILTPDYPRLGPTPHAHLLYVYRWQSDRMEPDLSELTPGNLLIPPQWTNRLGWIRGFHQTIAHYPLTVADRLPVHCFYSASRRVFLDERGNRLPQRLEPCGEWGLGGYYLLDRDISKALGMPHWTDDVRPEGLGKQRR
jgi:hypothetical protein